MYRTQVMQSIGDVQLASLPADMADDEKDKEAAKLTYKKIDESKGHELAFYKALWENDSFPGARQFVKVAC
jgi:hypothetical protein